MAEAVKIKIAKISRKAMPSKFKEGETYDIVTIRDEVSSRVGSAMGNWCKEWKEGSEVEGIWEKKIDKDGVTERWDIKNPTPPEKKGFTNYAPKKPSIVDAYTVAAMLAPTIFKDTKFKIDIFVSLADRLKGEFDKHTPAAVGTAEKKEDKTPVIDVAKEEIEVKKKKPEAKDFNVEDDDDEEVKDEDLF